MTVNKRLCFALTFVIFLLTISGAPLPTPLFLNTGVVVEVYQPGIIALPIIFNNHVPPSDWWLPAPNATWQWQLSDTPIDMSFNVDMYDIDLFENNAGVVANLHARGRRVICYFSAGSWENWRPDKHMFPEDVIGKDYEGWPDEKWLDIRRIDLLAPIMQARMDQCKSKGFDGVEPDNIDGYTNDTGFKLTYQDQLVYNKWLAGEAHARGLSIGLKNNSDQAVDLLPYFDWAMTEGCYVDDFCDQMTPFTSAGKAVFAAEYTDEISLTIFENQVCPLSDSIKFNFILKDRDLDAWVKFCP